MSTIAENPSLSILIRRKIYRHPLTHHPLMFEGAKVQLDEWFNVDAVSPPHLVWGGMSNYFLLIFVMNLHKKLFGEDRAEDGGDGEQQEGRVEYDLGDEEWR